MHYNLTRNAWSANIDIPADTGTCYKNVSMSVELYTYIINTCTHTVMTTYLDIHVCTYQSLGLTHDYTVCGL